jgi:membrane protein required for colicin V production
MPMLDIFLILVIIVSALISAFTGIVKILFSAAAFALGILAAIVFNSKVSAHFSVLAPLGSKIAAFIIIFIIVFLAIKILQSIVAGLFAGEILKGLDRALGFLFGVVQGLFFAAVILFVLKTQTFIDVSSLLAASYFYHIFETLITPAIARETALFFHAEVKHV